MLLKASQSLNSSLKVSQHLYTPISKIQPTPDLHAYPKSNTRSILECGDVRNLRAAETGLDESPDATGISILNKTRPLGT